MHMWFRLTVAAALCAAMVSVAAQDKVRVRYLPAYPPPNLSFESISIEITRVPALRRERELDVDRFFDAVEKALAEYRVSPTWQHVIVHAPSVQIEIVIDGKTYSLSSSYSDKGLDMASDKDGSNERHRQALGEILRLTTQRLSTMSPVQ